MRSLITTMMFVLHLHAMKDSSLVETTCRNTPNYSLCIQTLHSSPLSAKADVAGLGLIMVDAVRSKANEALATINRLKRTRPDLKRELSDCADGYNAILKADMPEAVEALVKGDPKFAEDGVADAASEADWCEKSFRRAKSPLTGVNRSVHDLAVVARAIIRNLL